MKTRPLTAAILLALLALALHGLALLAVARLRGSADAYAFQSPDAAEYLALARGLARHHRFVPLDPAGRPLGGPDAWRTPGYPLFLAAALRAAGDTPLRLLLAQQLLAVAAVPLLHALLRRFAPPRYATLATLAWLLDPFRLYYSLWLMPETLFVCLLLVALLIAAHARRHAWPAPACLALGALAGLLVLVRPIALLLPPLAVLAPAAGRRGRAALCCAAGTLAVLAPWLLRNHVVAGHLALSHQSGPSFAYHKVADVILWSTGRHHLRFDAQTLAAVRDELDAELQKEWETRFGPLSRDQRRDLTWHRLNVGQTRTIDPFLASRLLWKIGWQKLAERPGAAAVGTAYAALVALAILGLAAAVRRRDWTLCCVAMAPALALLLPALPFEDPRFRLPMMPLLWLMAIGSTRSRPDRADRPAPPAPSAAPTNSCPPPPDFS